MRRHPARRFRGESAESHAAAARGSGTIRGLLLPSPALLTARLTLPKTATFDFVAPVAAALGALALPPQTRLLLGIDTVSVAGIRESLAAFGARFEARLFTAHELHSASRGTATQREERLAARFAAKEATLKAYGWAEAGVDWRDIEVRTDPASGQPSLVLHGRAATLAAAQASGPASVSLSHDGDQAVAVVAALAAWDAPPAAMALTPDRAPTPSPAPQPPQRAALAPA